MYNLIEYSKNYIKTLGSLWIYCRDEPNNPPVDNYNADSITGSSITGKTTNNDNDNNNTKHIKVVGSLLINI